MVTYKDVLVAQERRKQHEIAGRLVLRRASENLICDEQEVFRLAYALSGDSPMLHWRQYVADKIVPELVYNFSLDVLALRIAAIPHVAKKKARKK